MTLILFFPLSVDWLITWCLTSSERLDLTVYMSNMMGILWEAGTAYLSRAPDSTPRLFGGVGVDHLFSYFVLSCYALWVPCCDVRYDICMKTMFGSCLPPIVCRRVHVLYTSFFCLRTVVSNIYFVVFLFCLSSSCVLCTQCCQFLWIAPSVCLTFNYQR